MASSNRRGPLEILADPASSAESVQQAFAELLKRPDTSARLSELSAAIMADGETLSAAECRVRLDAYVECELSGRNAAAEFPLVAHLIAEDAQRAEEYRVLIEGLKGIREDTLPEPDMYPDFDLSFVRGSSASKATTTVVPAQGRLLNAWSAARALLAPARGTEKRKETSRSMQSAGASSTQRREVNRTRRSGAFGELVLPLTALAVLAILLLWLPRSTNPFSASDGTPTQTATVVLDTTADETPDAAGDISPAGPLGPGTGNMGSGATSIPSASPSSGTAAATPTRMPATERAGEDEDPSPTAPRPTDPRPGTAPTEASPDPTLPAYPDPSEPPTLVPPSASETPVDPIPSSAPPLETPVPATMEPDPPATAPPTDLPAPTTAATSPPSTPAPGPTTEAS